MLKRTVNFNLYYFIFLEQTETHSENVKNTTQALPRSGKIDDETLISFVYARRPLWDFRMPLTERTGLKSKKLWEEVAQSLEGNYYKINL